MSETTANDLLTLGQIASRLGVPVHRARYAIDLYKIQPVTRIGIIRVWQPDALERIASALRRIGNKGRASDAC